MLRGLVETSTLAPEQQAHIDSLQDEIDQIWSRRGDYQIDPDAWETMPLFMNSISEEDCAKNEECAALASIVFDEMPADEVAENRKEHGNRALVMALNPAQDRRENLARTACHAYTDALEAKGKDKKLSCTIYANRSLAQFIIGNYGHGLEDAQRAVILDPTYVKAYYRAAKCAERVRKYDMCVKMLDHGLEVIAEEYAAAAVATAEGATEDATAAAAAKWDRAVTEFQELRALCESERERVAGKDTTLKRGQRVQAVKLSNIARAITSAGVKLTGRSEVSSEQMGVYGNPQPYFDSDHLHVPVLFMYDEYSQTDIMQDVACDTCAAELLEELMPFPWDDRGRYAAIENILVFYKIDDGVREAQCYEVDLGWPLMEVFRSATYEMPQLLPVLHVICKDSELIGRMKIHRCS